MASGGVARYQEKSSAWCGPPVPQPWIRLVCPAHSFSLVSRAGSYWLINQSEAAACNR
jgi:hypothetical protein